jgi:pimeloyl-ACP methyl ester carboxylesterase
LKKLDNMKKNLLVMLSLVVFVTGCSREKAVYRPYQGTNVEKHLLSTSLHAIPGHFQPETELQKAIELESRDRIASIWAYRNVCIMTETEAANQQDLEKLAAIHRVALRRLFHVTGADQAVSPADLAEKLGTAGITIRLSDPDWAGLEFTKLVPCEDYENRNIEPIVTVAGWGLPILADRIYIKHEIRSPAETFFPPDNRLTCTARLGTTVVGPISHMDLSQVPAELVLHSPFDEETIQLPSGQQVQLAADFTTPSLVQFSQSGLQALEYEGLLLPELVQKKASIYLNEPYRPGKIPVLFVHGLWSSPRTWTDMNNQLLADPEIRRNYQFFFALYPTGEPVLDSAMIIREKIRKLRDTFDPARQDPAWDQMVVVCHSMGGIVSRLLITDSGNTFENAFLAKPIEELTISDDTRNRLMQRLRFEPVPEISRVAFLAPVFRGSSFASRPIGRISSTLINKVDYLSEVRNEIVSNNGYESIKPAYRGAWIANGIDNLQPDNPTLKALDQTTPNPNTKYHVILGDNGKLLPKLRGMITDGLVTYQSGHLDGAESEVIFDANHYLNHDKPIIDEVHRILRHHIGMSTIETIVENVDRNEIRR